MYNHVAEVSVYVFMQFLRSVFLLYYSRTTEKLNAGVAQLVAQRIRNAWVAGSSPASGFKSERKISLKSKENQGFPAVWGDFFVVLGVKDE